MSRAHRTTAVVVLILGILFSSISISDIQKSPTSKAAVKKYTRYAKIANLEVHKKPSASSEVVKTLIKYQKVTQYGSANKKGWVKICYKKGHYGYVKKSSLKSKRSAFEHYKYDNTLILATAKKYGWTVDKAEYEKWEKDIFGDYSMQNQKYLLSINGQFSTNDFSKYRIHLYDNDIDNNEIWNNIGKSNQPVSVVITILKNRAVA